MSSQAKKLRQDAQFQILRLIYANPKITQRELSGALGISLGSTHYIIKALANIGLIKVERFAASKTKSSYAYILTPSGLAEKSALAAMFLARKQREYEVLRQEIKEIGVELNQNILLDD